MSTPATLIYNDADELMALDEVAREDNDRPDISEVAMENNGHPGNTSKAAMESNDHSVHANQADMENDDHPDNPNEVDMENDDHSDKISEANTDILEDQEASTEEERKEDLFAFVFGEKKSDLSFVDDADNHGEATHASAEEGNDAVGGAPNREIVQEKDDVVEPVTATPSVLTSTPVKSDSAADRIIREISNTVPLCIGDLNCVAEKLSDNGNNEERDSKKRPENTEEDDSGIADIKVDDTDRRSCDLELNLDTDLLKALPLKKKANKKTQKRRGRSTRSIGGLAQRLKSRRRYQLREDIAMRVSGGLNGGVWWCDECRYYSYKRHSLRRHQQVAHDH